MPGEHVSHHFEINAYLAEALSVTDLKPRQEALGVEEREAERLISLASAGHVLAEDRLEVGAGCWRTATGCTPRRPTPSGGSSTRPSSRRSADVNVVSLGTWNLLPAFLYALDPSTALPP